MPLPPGAPPPPGMRAAPSFTNTSSAIPKMKPKTRMRSFNWSKLPVQRVIQNQNSIWSKVHQIPSAPTGDWSGKMEELFGQQNMQKKKGDQVQKKRESLEINLLDNHRSLNVNILLKQFKGNNDSIIRLIEDGKGAEIGVEKLKSLLKLMPQSEEIEMLNSFNGDAQKLGEAEKFCIQLIAVPNCKLRIESMLLKEEFASTLDYLVPSIESIIQAAQELRNCTSLKEILYIVLLSGNFLNAGGYAGNAMGFKLSSLLKLVETRANKPRMNLLHYVASMAAQKNKNLIEFTSELGHIEEASRFSIDQLKEDLKAIEEKVHDIAKQIEGIDCDFKTQVELIIGVAKEEIKQINEMFGTVEIHREKLAEYFCEDVSTFQLQECLSIFKAFCEKFKIAVRENDNRREQEERAELRKKQRQQNRSFSKKTGAVLGPNFVRHNSLPAIKRKERPIVDTIIGNIRKGKDLRGPSENSAYRNFAGDGRTGPSPSHQQNEISSPLMEDFNNGNFSPSFNKLVNLNSSGKEPAIFLNHSVDSNKNFTEVDESPTITMLNESASLSSYRRNRRIGLVDSDELFEYLQRGEEEDISDTAGQAFKRDGSSRKRTQRKRLSRVVVDSRERQDANTQSAPSSPPACHTSKSSPFLSSLDDKPQTTPEGLGLRATDTQMITAKAEDIKNFRQYRHSYGKELEHSQISTPWDQIVNGTQPKGREVDILFPKIRELKEEEVTKKGLSSHPDFSTSVKPVDNLLPNGEDVQSANTDEKVKIQGGIYNSTHLDPVLKEPLPNRISVDDRTLGSYGEVSNRFFSEDEDEKENEKFPKDNEKTANVCVQNNNITTAENKDTRTSRRKNLAIYEDKSSNVFTDQPIGALLNLAILEEEDLRKLTDQQRIEEDRKEIENALQCTSPRIRRKGFAGLKALKKRQESIDIQDEEWQQIERQQLNIHKDIVDMTSDMSIRSGSQSEDRLDLTDLEEPGQVEKEFEQSEIRFAQYEEEHVQTDEGARSDVVIPIVGDDTYHIRSNVEVPCVRDIEKKGNANHKETVDSTKNKSINTSSIPNGGEKSKLPNNQQKSRYSQSSSLLTPKAAKPESSQIPSRSFSLNKPRSPSSSSRTVKKPMNKSLKVLTTAADSKRRQSAESSISEVSIPRERSASSASSSSCISQMSATSSNSSKMTAAKSVSSTRRSSTSINIHRASPSSSNKSNNSKQIKITETKNLAKSKIAGANVTTDRKTSSASSVSTSSSPGLRRSLSGRPKKTGSSSSSSEAFVREGKGRKSIPASYGSKVKNNREGTSTKATNGTNVILPVGRHKTGIASRINGQENSIAPRQDKPTSKLVVVGIPKSTNHLRTPRNESSTVSENSSVSSMDDSKSESRRVSQKPSNLSKSKTPSTLNRKSGERASGTQRSSTPRTPAKSPLNVKSKVDTGIGSRMNTASGRSSPKQVHDKQEVKFVSDHGKQTLSKSSYSSSALKKSQAVDTAGFQRNRGRYASLPASSRNTTGPVNLRKKKNEGNKFTKLVNRLSKGFSADATNEESHPTSVESIPVKSKLERSASMKVSHSQGASGSISKTASTRKTTVASDARPKRRVVLNPDSDLEVESNK